MRTKSLVTTACTEMCFYLIGCPSGAVKEEDCFNGRTTFKPVTSGTSERRRVGSESEVGEVS